MADPSPRHPARRGMTVRAPPIGHRVPTYPPATAAGVPGQYRLSAVPSAPDHDRSSARHKMAPGHGRPLAALSATRHDRPRATLRAPGVDVPLATAAGAPGQHRLSVVAIATVPSPAGLRRLRQVVLPRIPATPNTLTYPHSPPRHRAEPRKRETTSLRCYGGATWGPRTGNPAPCTPPLPPTHNAAPPPIKCILPSRFRPARGLAPPRVRASSASTPPAPHRTRVRHCGESRKPAEQMNMRGQGPRVPVIPAHAGIPLSPRERAGVRAAL